MFSQLVVAVFQSIISCLLVLSITIKVSSVVAMFKNAIVAARDRKTQAWFLLASLICFLIPASVAVAFFWRRNGPQHALSIIISLM